MSSESIVVAVATVFAIFGAMLLFLYRYRPFHSRSKRDPKTFGFFHPYASGGGGGERVLWKMIQVLQSEYEDVDIAIYTIDPPTTNEIDLRHDAEKRFDVSIPRPVRLISLQQYKDYLSPRPYLSLVMESYGTMKLARRALMAFEPDVFCDTTGCAFTFAVTRWMCPQAWILAYVHYPTISTDMMLWEWRKGGERNANSVVRRGKTVIKLVYYWLFALLYGLIGSLADLVMVNSTWTYNHISSLWRLCHQPVQIVYPPCRVPDTWDETENLQQSTQHEVTRNRTIVSIGQFRPEKNHRLQIEALSVLLNDHQELKSSESLSTVQLLLIGSCRNKADQTRVDELRELVAQLGLEDHVTFNINPPYQELQASMNNASIGIHTMREEHFGIGIVEMMAAQLLVIAHNSGGPRTDIVDPNVTGFLATTAEEYAAAIYQALTMTKEKEASMRKLAQKSASRFSDKAFDARLKQVLPLLTK
jgi:alpha-1,2-mannosyltransferase